ncbi:MAG: bifunctional nuclease family protein [Acidobacteria bacterium]|nr:bifunctional nuclease family protein [Acidobacteriota bacterium]
MKKRVSFFMGLLFIVCQPLVAQRRAEPVEVKVENLQATPVGVSITLRSSDSRDRVQMLIGFPEGQSIARAMNHEQGPRPMTHDLFKDFLDRNGWRVQKVLIRALQGGTFLADLMLENGRETQVYDARPSDAMAIGLRYDAKIFVNKEVFEQQKQEEERQQVKPSEPDTLRL